MVTFDGVDASAPALFGVVRPDARAHPAGTPVEPANTGQGHPFLPAPDRPFQTPAPPFAADDGHEDHEHHTAVENGLADSGGELIAPPDDAWKQNHCVDAYASHSIRAVYIYDSVNDPDTTLDDRRVTDPLEKIREELQAADRAIAQSHDTFKQHLRIRCIPTIFPPWGGIDIASYAPPVSRSTTDANTDADKNNNGFLECGEIQGFVRDYTSYGTQAGANRRHYWFYDSSVAGSACSFGSKSVLHDDARWDDPGTGNIGNTTYGDVSSDWAEWSAAGVSNRSVSVTLQEFFHSIGVVVGTAPSHCCVQRPAHSSDYPDFMNAGYCIPNPGVWDCAGNEQREITRTCSVPTSITYPDTYADCGRDDYWGPNVGTGSWLCTHYNLAWDSYYFHQRATPTPGCR